MADRTNAVQKTPAPRTVRALQRLDRAAGRRSFLPTIALFPLSDYALPFLPNQILLTVLAILHPRRWWSLAITFITAAAVGALLISVAVQAASSVIANVIGTDQSALASVTEQIDRYGLWILLALSLLPWPPRVAVVACAAVGIAPWAIAAVVLAGRSIPVTAMALTAAKMPHLLRRWQRVDRLLTAVETSRNAKHDRGHVGSGAGR
jgi:membrane protein YqaA with SNARE-associated domain